MSHLRIYERYFLGNVNVAMQDTSELSSGATCTAPGTRVQTGMGWDRLWDAVSAPCSAGMETS